jgi:molybdenum cofactor cytidylyltransferase
MPEIAALVLAAGAATRFRAAVGEGGPATKLVALFNGKPLVRHVVEAALASSSCNVIVVTGHARLDVEAALNGLPVQFVHNENFASGIASSLRAGVSTLRAIDGALVLLADMPMVSPALINAMIDAASRHPEAKAIVPKFGGQRGNPVLITKALFPAVAHLTGDVGAKFLLAAAGEDVVEVEFPDAAVVFDVDTPQALSD